MKAHSRYTFTADSVSCNGRTFHCEYSVTKSGKAFVFADVKGEKIRFEVDKGDADYAALIAAVTGKPIAENVAANVAETVSENVAENVSENVVENVAANVAENVSENVAETVSENVAETAVEVLPEPIPDPIPETVSETVAETSEIETLKRLIAEQDAKIAALEAMIIKPTKKCLHEIAKNTAKTVVEKAVEEVKAKQEHVEHVDKSTFAGKTIDGNGWKIVFDEMNDRTRLIFDEKPTTAQKAVIDEYGFYWSNALKSFNKKLTVRAFRKATEMAAALKAL